MSAMVWSTVFGGELCAGGVVGAEDVDIDEAWEGIVWGILLVDLDLDSIFNCLVGVEACPRRF